MLLHTFINFNNLAQKFDVGGAEMWKCGNVAIPAENIEER